MDEWTASVSGGSVKPVADNIIAIHTGYLFGNVTAIRTGAGLVLVDTGSRETASQTLAALRRWDDSPVHTVVYTHGHIDHTWGARLPTRRPMPEASRTRASSPTATCCIASIATTRRMP
jgi:glyoxylase-like metal-dependent hydrolase (beta-lactamase superfamily II)